MTALRNRSEIPTDDTWNLSSIFASDEAWEGEMGAIEALLPTLDRFHGHLGDSPDALADWFEASADLFTRLGKLYNYASLLQTVDATDQKAATMTDRIGGLWARATAAAAFAEPELLALDAEMLHGWSQGEPRLQLYAHYLNDLFHRQAHVRSAEVEELLGMVAEPFGTVYLTAEILTSAEMPFPDAETAGGEAVGIAQGTIDPLLASPDRTLRQSAWERYSDGFLALKNTLANNLAASIKQTVFTARARRYDSALEAALEPHGIPVEVFHNLIETYRQNLPTWHRYWRVRREALGYDTLHVYDIKAPLARNPRVIPYDQAVQWISEGMAPLGREYVGAMREGLLEERWVDRYPNQGKRGGAFSAGSPGTHAFILMNYTDDLDSVSTLAHELGHSLHSFLTWQTQPFVYSNYSLFVAEVASNFNQALVRAHLLEQEEDPDFQIAVIEEAMSNFHRYFFIMPTLARFELEMHERVERGEGLSADGMIARMDELFREGYGDEVAEDHERIGITWAQFPHLYASFYVYQYATGISGAHALAERVLAGEAGTADAYLTFLRAGSSAYPLDVLRAAGVDLTTPEPVERAFLTLARYVDRLETLVRARNERNTA